VKPLDALATQRATSIAGAAVAPAHVHTMEEALPQRAQIGVVYAVRLSHVLATTAGFGVDGRDVDVLVVQHFRRSGMGGMGASLSGRFGSPSGKLVSPTGVATLASAAAVRLGSGKAGALGLSPGSSLDRLEDLWMLKLVFDPPEGAPYDAASDAAARYLGQHQVTISTREGIVLVRGEVELTHRGANEQPSRRYDYRAATGAATLLQARHRGRAARKKYVELGGSTARSGGSARSGSSSAKGARQKKAAAPKRR